MSKKIILLVVLSIAAFGGFYFYLENTRYDIKVASRGLCYKVDHRSGRVWAIFGGEELLVRPSSEPSKPARKKEIDFSKLPDQPNLDASKPDIFDRISSENLSMSLAKKSRLGGDTAEEGIKIWLAKKKGLLHVWGWKCRKVNEQTYLVGYIFDDDSGKKAFLFEVNLPARLVRNISEDPELQKLYGVKTEQILTKKQPAKNKKPGVLTFDEFLPHFPPPVILENDKMFK